jgi:hypothetical protein
MGATRERVVQGAGAGDTGEEIRVVDNNGNKVTVGL